MRASLDTHLLSYLYLILLSSFYPLSSSASFSCELQEQLNLNRFYKAGDLVLGGLFYIHYSSVLPELSFTSKQQEPTCYQ